MPMCHACPCRGPTSAGAYRTVALQQTQAVAAFLLLNRTQHNTRFGVSPPGSATLHNNKKADRGERAVAGRIYSKAGRDGGGAGRDSQHGRNLSNKVNCTQAQC